MAGKAPRGGPRPSPAAQEALGGLAGGFGIKVDGDSFKLADKAISGLAARLSVLKERSVDALRVGGVGKESIKDVAGLAKGLVGVADVAQQVAGKIYSTFREAFDQVGGLAGQLGHAARAGGGTTQEFQGLAHTVSRAGISMEQLGATLQDIRAKQYATKFSTEANFAFQQLGVGVRDASGKFKAADVFLEQAVEKLISIRDPAERTGRALATVGQTGLDLANYFSDKGIDAFRAYRREVKELGAELSTTDVQAVAGYRFELSRLQLVAQGFRNAVAGPLHQALGAVSGQFADWLRTVQGPLRAGLRQAVTSLAGLGPVLLSIGQGLVKLLPLFGVLVQFLGAVGTVAGTVAAGVLSLVDGLSSMGETGAAVAFGLFAAFFPMLALFAGIVLIIEDLIVFGRGGKSLFGDALEGFQKWKKDVLGGNQSDPYWLRFVKELAVLLFDEIPGGLAGFINLLTEAFVVVGTKAKELWEAVAASFREIGQWWDERGKDIAAVKGVFSQAGGAVAEVFRGNAASINATRAPTLTQPVSPYDPAALEKFLATPQGKAAGKEFVANISIVGARASEAKEIGEIAVKAVAEWFDASVLGQSGRQQ